MNAYCVEVVFVVVDTGQSYGHPFSIIKLRPENTNNVLSFGLKTVCTEVQQSKGGLPGSSRPPSPEVKGQ